MSSENNPVREPWTRRARVAAVRKQLLIALGICLIAVGSVAWLAHRRAAPVESAAVPAAVETPALSASEAVPAPADVSVPPAGTSSETSLALRLSPAEGGDSLILAPVLSALPSPPLPEGVSPPAAESNGVPELPMVTVAPRNFHAVPEDENATTIGPVILSDRQGRTIKVLPSSRAGSLPSTYVPSVGPAARARNGAMASAASAPQYPSNATGPRSLSPVVANPPVFSGRARAAGPLALDVQGKIVALFGVRGAQPQDRCNEGKGGACATAAQAALQAQLSGHPIVACRVPPGQRGGETSAICLDEQGNDLGRYLVIQGFALADSAQSYDYLPAEGAARTAKRGLWRNR
jgi:endonuclease YncB( thermonuclease family)